MSECIEKIEALLLLSRIEKSLDAWVYAMDEKDAMIATLRSHVEELEREIARLREQVRWRKYPEEKPGELTEVFAWDKDIDSIVLEYYANWEDTGYRFEDLHITYWMPLPEPPEVE